MAQFLDTVTLTNANQVYNLWSLLSASMPTLPTCAQALMLQVDRNANSSAHIFIGDGKLRTIATSYGADLSAGWTYSIDSQQSNMLSLNELYLRSDTSSILVHVTVIVR